MQKSHRNVIVAPKLRAGDTVRIITPARSMSIISKETRDLAKKNFDKLGLRLTFGSHAEESDEHQSMSLESRIRDFHEAVADKNVKAVISVIGGFNTNQMLRKIDWDTVGRNPKIYCGFCDYTTLLLPIYKMCGLITYYGPHYATFGQKYGFEYTLNYFKKCLMSDLPYQVEPTREWSNDLYYLDQENRKFIKNKGWLVINEGKAEGRIIGGNIEKISLLQGSPYMPDFSNSIAFLQEAGDLNLPRIDQHLQAMINSGTLDNIKGLMIGRFENDSGVTTGKLKKLFLDKPEFSEIPIVANLDFGHTMPMFTFPVGGTAEFEVLKHKQHLKITEH